MTQAKKYVEDQRKTGQGMLDDQNYSQEEFQEARLVSLLYDANKGCQPPKTKTKFYGAQSRYYEGKDAPSFVGSLEESVCLMFKIIFYQCSLFLGHIKAAYSFIFA